MLRSSGLIALVVRLYSDASAEDIIKVEPEFVEAIGLSQHLSPTRANGLASMLQRLKGSGTIGCEIHKRLIWTDQSYIMRIGTICGAPMVRLSKLTDYASVILAQMARYPDVLWSAGQLSDESSIPKPTCTKLLKLLVKGGIADINARRSGGYSLARAPSQIPVKVIIEAIEGPTAITECGTDELWQLCTTVQ